MSSNTKIPNSWTKVEIEKILAPAFNGKTIQQGWSPRCERFPSEGSEKWGVLKTTAIQEGEFLPHENKQLPERLHPRDQIEVQAGDIVMTCAGPRQRCGVTCLVPETRARLMMSGKMYRFRPVEKHFNSKYLQFVLHSQDAKNAIDRMKTGINDSGLNLTHDRFRQLLVPVAPQNEQHRIVAKIEELFSELDKGIESLKTAREQLKVYRQALLKYAFEGKLTEQWRKDNADKLETADQLMERINLEREASYKKQQEEWNEAAKEWESFGKEGKSPPRPKYKKFNVDCSKHEGLPGSWGMVALERLISFGPTNGWSPKAVSEVTGTKAITLTATTSGKFDDSQYKYIDTRIPEHSSLWLKRNDVLIQRGNTIEYVGVPALYSGEDNEFIYPDLMMKIQTVDSISAQFIVYAMSMSSSRSFLRERAVGAAGSMPKINQKTLSSLPIPICSEVEQKIIVEQLEEKLSVTDSGIQEIEVQLSKAEVLRQSILKKAFSGQLVPQDSNDEPASALLERIAKEKEQVVAKAKKAKAAQKKSKTTRTSTRKAS